MNNTTAFIIGVCIAAALTVGLNTGLAKQEVVECRKWQSQSQEYRLFYLTKWQSEQCEAHGILIKTSEK